VGQCDCTNTAQRTDSPVERLPRWGAKLAHRLAMLERGRVHMVAVIVPEAGDAEPSWTVQSSTRLENTR
jgi:hypothetical protein